MKIVSPELYAKCTSWLAQTSFVFRFFFFPLCNAPYGVVLRLAGFALFLPTYPFPSFSGVEKKLRRFSRPERVCSPFPFPPLRGPYSSPSPPPGYFFFSAYFFPCLGYLRLVISVSRDVDAFFSASFVFSLPFSRVYK